MYKKSAKGRFKHFDFMMLDLLVLHLSFVISYTIRHEGGNPYAEDLYRGMASFLTLADISIVFFADPYRDVLKRGFYGEFKAVVLHSVIIELFAVMFLFIGKNSDEYSRATMLLMGGIFPFISYFIRLGWKKHLTRKRKRSDARSLLIVTPEYMAAGTILDIQENSYNAFSIAGLVLLDADKVGQKIEGVRVVATKEDAARYAQKRWVDEVFINVPNEIPFPQSLANDFVEMGMSVHMNLPRVSGIHGKKQVADTVGSFTVLTASLNFATAGQAFMKRMLDIIGGLIGCMITGVLCLFVAPAIYISSPGPIFFTQERIGKNGKKFKMYKFRSMYMDAEERKKDLMKMNQVDSDLMFKLDFDPRIIGNEILPDGTKKTGIGQFIRSTSIDEFPQFLNVLKGDMSLVGTRPPLTSEFNAYKMHHRARMAVKPGITGLWQVSGRSKITDFEEVVRLDKKYIEEWNMGLDIRILLQTVKVVLSREGSV